MLFHMPQRITPQLHLNIKGSPIENVNKFNFLGLTLDCNLNFKPHTLIIVCILVSYFNEELLQL